jgi:hypothetical protein
MQVLMSPEESMARGKRKGKQRQGQGAPAPSLRQVAEQLQQLVLEQGEQWLQRLTDEPAAFADIERQVHERLRQQADRLVAGLLASASEREGKLAAAVDQVLAHAEVPLRAVEKKDAP